MMAAGSNIAFKTVTKPLQIKTWLLLVNVLFNGTVADRLWRTI